jgi:hypothetical protein
MKAIFLAVVTTIALFLTITYGFRVNWTERRARLMASLYFAFLVLMVVGWIAAPPDCGFLPHTLLVEPAWLDFLLCIFFFSAAFFGGLLQLYNLADRGFSLRILIDVLESKEGETSVDRELASYSAGHGIAWMYNKRLAGLIYGRFVLVKDEYLTLTPKGAKLADLFARLREFLNMKAVLR